MNTVIDENAADLSRPLSPDVVGDEPSVTLVASMANDIFRRHTLPDEGTAEIAGALVVNPLYQVERTNTGSRLLLTFPTAEYEEEFGGCRRYLPDSIDVAADVTGAITPASFGADYGELRRRRVLLDVPARYC
jgi:hypothetical protein